MIVSLPDNAEGAYIVRTVSGSTYLIDLGSAQPSLTRVREDDDAYHQLRRDGQQVDLLRIEHCRVGDPALLLIDVHVPGVPFTARTTTPVLSITESRHPHA